MVVQRLSLKAVPALMAAILLAGPLTGSARAAPVTAAIASQLGTTQLTPDTPDHIAVLQRIVNNIRNDYAAYSNTFGPGAQDILDYNIPNLWLKGFDGAGTTVALLEGWTSPNLQTDLEYFDTQFGLPDADISTIFPGGPLPAQCPAGMQALGSYGSCSAWGSELELDVEAVHLIAPYARILIAVTPADSEVTDDPVSNVAPPEMMHAIEYIAANQLANVISVSTGSGETTYEFGATEIHANDPGLLAAAAAGIPVLNGTGDCGVVQNLATASAQCQNTSPGPDVATWNDSPWVTAVGGTIPNLDPSTGLKQGSDPIWNEGNYGEGAGFSAIYPRPSYQDDVAQITGSAMRSVPDITMDAEAGTSQAAPLLAGVLALATQVNEGRNVGPINPALYGVLGPAGSADGIMDVVNGNNTYTNPRTGVTVPGFSAGPGFDVASGWGTIYAKSFVPALVTATAQSDQENAARSEASRELSQLQDNITLSAADIPSGGTLSLSADGYQPFHPVELSVDGRPIISLTADAAGTVDYLVDPAALGLTPGNHVLTLQSMLLTSTASFSTG